MTTSLPTTSRSDVDPTDDVEPATDPPAPARRNTGVTSVSLPMVLVFLAPALVLYLVFVAYPIVQSARYSFYDWNGLEPLTDFVGLDNFTRALDDPVFRGSVGHNALIIVLSLVVQLPIALGLALLLNQRLRGQAVLRTLFFAPYILSEVVTAVVWRQVMRPAGFLDQILIDVGAGGLIKEWLADPAFVLYSVFFIISWKYFGFHMILMLAGLQQLPASLTEAAAIDGATPWQTLRYITMPLLAPTLRVSAFLSMIGAIQLFDLVRVTTNGGPVNASSTMATYLVDQAFRRNQFGYASAVSILMFGLSLLVAVGYQRFALRRDLEGSW